MTTITITDKRGKTRTFETVDPNDVKPEDVGRLYSIGRDHGSGPGAARALTIETTPLNPIQKLIKKGKELIG